VINTQFLRNVNLNILPVMWELLRVRNVSLAAANLNLTQSTVSAALKRLREMFDDEILVQQGRRMVLTERAEALLPLLEACLDHAGALVGGNGFDPASSTVKFRVVTADYVTAIVAPELLRGLQDRAPGVSVQFAPGHIDDFKAFRMSSVDVAIGPDQTLRWLGADERRNDFRIEPCFTDPLVAIERNTAPPGAHLHDAAAFLCHPHASFQFTRDFAASVERDTLEALDVAQNDRLLVPEFTLLPMLVASLGVISVVPQALARLFVRVYPIRVFTPPIAYAPLTLNLLWSRARDRDPALSWFVGELRGCFDRLRVATNTDQNYSCDFLVAKRFDL
jgi:LysR family nod box-dependent transcriptional activator